MFIVDSSQNASLRMAVANDIHHYAGVLTEKSPARHGTHEDVTKVKQPILSRPTNRIYIIHDE